jgi:protein-disulfide isomerase
MKVRFVILLLPVLVGLAVAAQFGGMAEAAGGQLPALGAGPAAEFEAWFAKQPRTYLPIDAGGAAVLVVKFSDYQCPPCAQSYANQRPILARYQQQFPGAIKFVVKDFPLASGCNPIVKQSVHIAACEAAVAVRLASRGGKGSAMEEWLFSHQPTLTPEVVREAARTVGGVTDFDQAYAKTLELVRADVAMGQALNVQQTPTFFVNGVRFDGEPMPQFFEVALVHELKKAGRLR